MVVSPPASYEDLRIDMRSLAAALWRRKLRIGLLTVLVCAATWYVLTTVTPVFEASASILVEARDNAFTRATTEQIARSGGADDAAIESQVQLVQSRETLLSVIESEGLRDVAELNRPGVGLVGTVLGLIGLADAPAARFTSDEALVAEMRDRLSVARASDSRVISITFGAEDPALAARVANALAVAHVQRRGDLLLEDTSDATVWLEREIDDMRARVSEAEARVANYRVENDLFEGSGDSSLLEQQMSDVTAQISAAAERRGAADARSKLIRGLLDAGEPVETIAEVRDSPVVQQLAEQKASLQAQRAERAATLLAGHPDIRALDAQIAELTAEIQAEGRRIARALESQARIEVELEQSLRDELTRLKIQASNAQISGVSLAELEREAAAQRDLLNAFLIRYREAAARISSDATLPDVRIVSSAAEPTQPVYPQKGMLVAAVGMVALVLQAGGVVLGELAGGTVFVPRARREDEEVEDVREASVAKWTGGSEEAPEDAADAEPAAATVWEPVARAAETSEPLHPPLRDEPEMIIERVLAESQPESAGGSQSAFAVVEPEPEAGVEVEVLAEAEVEAASQLEAEPPLESAPEPRVAQVEEEFVEPVEEPEPVEPAQSAVTEIDASDAHEMTETPEAEPAPDRHGPESGPIAELAALASGSSADSTEDNPDRLFSDGELPDVFGEPVSEPLLSDTSEATADESGEETRSDVAWGEVARTEPEAAEEAAPEASANDKPRESRFGKSVAHIAMHLAANADRLTVVASSDDTREDRVVAGKIAIDLTGRGLAVALVDAGGAGGELDGPGITDLAAGLSDFGDVVHRVESQGLYHVPWGRQAELDITSPNIQMLLEALGELHDHVIVMCGPMGDGSALPYFAKTGAGLILASKSEATVEQVARLSNQARETGFAHVSLARADSSSSEVA